MMDGSGRCVSVQNIYQNPNEHGRKDCVCNGPGHSQRRKIRDSDDECGYRRYPIRQNDQCKQTRHSAHDVASGAMVVN